MKQILVILGIMTAIFSAWFFMENRFADATYVSQIEKRLDVKINQDKIDYIRKELREVKWCLEAEPDNKRCKNDLDELRDKLADELKKRESLYK